MTFAWTWRRVRRTFDRQPGPILALGGAFALFMLLLGTARLASRLAESLVPRLADNVHVIAYLREDMSAARAAALADIVVRVPGVERVRAVSSTEALARLRREAQAVGGAATGLDGLEEGFLPRSLEVRLSASEGLAARAQALASRLRRIPGIAEVDAMQDGLSRLRSILGLLRTLALGLLALALVTGGAVLTLPLLQGRPRRQEEVAALTLLGETPAGMRRPWAIVGALSALAGSLVAWGALWAVHAGLVHTWVAALGEWLPPSLPFVPWREALVASLAALAVGAWVGKRALPAPRGQRA
ncbi:MAG: permease-like cell division protein FtsX [Myxococcales bacterium]|nr:permease-like cell division protein FtsX [Myxococcales bacterium]